MASGGEQLSCHHCHSGTSHCPRRDLTCSLCCLPPSAHCWPPASCPGPPSTIPQMDSRATKSLENVVVLSAHALGFGNCPQRSSFSPNSLSLSLPSRVSQPGAVSSLCSHSASDCYGSRHFFIVTVTGRCSLHLVGWGQSANQPAMPRTVPHDKELSYPRGECRYASCTIPSHVTKSRYLDFVIFSERIKPESPKVPQMACLVS